MPGITVFSGGTACNSIVPVLNALVRDREDAGVTYVLGVSDNGGSTSEILRVLGGPAIGDLRSRLTRLIPIRSNELPEIRSETSSNALEGSKSEKDLNALTSGDVHRSEIGLEASNNLPTPTIKTSTEEAKSDTRSSGSAPTLQVTADTSSTVTETEDRLRKMRTSEAGSSLYTLPALTTSGIECMPNIATQRVAMHEMLSYRLPSDKVGLEIKEEWGQIVEGTHRLWKNIPSEKKEVIRGFLVFFHTEVLKRAHKRFDFRNASVGNCFLTGARMFFGSLESAIFQFAAITGIEDPTQVVPVVNTNHSVNIAARLVNGAVILGQCQISHPSKTTFETAVAADGDVGGEATNVRAASPRTRARSSFGEEKITGKSHLIFDKSDETDHLAHRIQKIYYINEYGKEIFPHPNPKLLRACASTSTLIYSMGSLYTSIHPTLILRGVGAAIARSPTLTTKILLLNGHNDRETPLYTAVDFVKSIVGALNSSLKTDRAQWPRQYPTERFVTHLVALEASEIVVDVWTLEKMGVHVAWAKGARDEKGRPCHDEEEIFRILATIIDGGG